MTNKKILILIFVVAFLTLLVGCLPGITPSPPKGVIGGRIMAPPGSETTKDITGWIPLANATVTITDSEGVTHTVTTDEDGYYTFADIAVDANTIITATGTVDGNTVIVKDVIPQAVAADEDYEAGIADAESTALALIVEELLEQGLDPGDINLEEIKASDNFNEVVEQVNSILEGNGNVTTDPGLTNTVGNLAEDIINPPEPTPEPTPSVNHAPIINSSPVITAIMGVEYIYDVEATDPDGDTLTYSLTANPSGMAINSGTGIISWIPTAVGDYPVKVEVSDGKLSDSQPFTITVSTVEISGIVVLPETMTLFEGESKTIQSVIATYVVVKGFEAPIALGDCTYQSSDEAIATVSDGVITGVGEGTTTITVNYASLDDTLEVTVVLPVHNITQNLYYNIIQVAITGADPGDIIEVAAGTYPENIIIDRSLIVVSVDGPEVTIINAQGISFGIFIIGETTTATFEGFTVENYIVAGILAGSFGEPEEDPLEAHILNNIVKEPMGEEHNNCIQIGDGTTGTIIGNEVFGASLVDPDWSGSGIIVAGSSNVLVSNNYVHDCEGGIQIVGYVECRDAPAEDNIIEYNLVENNESGIVPQMYSIGTIIRYNDVLNNDEGIAVMAIDYSWEHSTPSGTEIHYNNIVGNINYGVKSSIWGSNTGSVPIEQVDATDNWWGSEYGPKYDGFPANGGDTVSDNVDYEHFLTSEY